MTRERLDEEVLAAFLDGTLPRDERARVLTRLAADPEAYAEFLDASHLVAAVQGADQPATPSIARPSRSRWRRNLAFAGPFLAAAGIAGAVFFSRSSSAPDVIQVAQEWTRPPVSGPGSLARTFGPDWDVPGWPVVRGGASGATAGTAARLGARLVQLDVTTRAGDSVATVATLAAIRDLTASIEGAGPSVLLLQSAVTLPDGERRDIMQRLRALAGQPAAFDAGVWLESARLATAWNDTAFFAPEGVTYRALQRVVGSLERANPGPAWDGVLTPLKTLGTTAPSNPDAAAPLVRAALEALPR